MGQHDFAGQLVGTNFVVIQTRLGLAHLQNALRHLLGAERTCRRSSSFPSIQGRRPGPHPPSKH